MDYADLLSFDYPTSAPTGTGSLSTLNIIFVIFFFVILPLFCCCGIPILICIALGVKFTQHDNRRVFVTEAAPQQVSKYLTHTHSLSLSLSLLVECMLLCFLSVTFSLLSFSVSNMFCSISNWFLITFCSWCIQGSCCGVSSLRAATATSTAAAAKRGAVWPNLSRLNFTRKCQ